MKKSISVAGLVVTLFTTTACGKSIQDQGNAKTQSGAISLPVSEVHSEDVKTLEELNTAPQAFACRYTDEKTGQSLDTVLAIYSEHTALFGKDPNGERYVRMKVLLDAGVGERARLSGVFPRLAQAQESTNLLAGDEISVIDGDRERRQYFEIEFNPETLAGEARARSEIVERGGDGNVVRSLSQNDDVVGTLSNCQSLTQTEQETN